MKRSHILLVCLVLSASTGWASTNKALSQQSKKAKKKKDSSSLLIEKIDQQNKTAENPFGISLFHPNYLLPAYYTWEPYRSIYINNTPDHQSIENLELKFQISFRAPVIRHFFSNSASINVGYTQQSWWQAYNDSAFFRETNYKPEVFFEKRIFNENYNNLHVRLFDFGLVHESNGRGGALERSWNRAYVSISLEDGGFVMRIKPWYIIHESSLKRYNPDIAKYLGYGNILLMYHFKKLDVSLMLRNILESDFRKGAEQITISYPLNKRFRIYILGFSGYGQSLIEYNHYTEATAIGFALNDNI